VDRDRVLAVERGYVAGATARGEPLAAAAAVASRFLAVGTPRSLAVIGDGPGARDVLAAHRTWFEPRDVRCTEPAVAAALGGRVVARGEALAADIVCICAPLALAAAELRRGTHVNALAEVALDDDLRRLAIVVDERGLCALAAGLVDGRQLDELTVFVAGTAAIAAAALA